jgi:hypothetical protein
VLRTAVRGTVLRFQSLILDQRTCVFTLTRAGRPERDGHEFMLDTALNSALQIVNDLAGII